MSSPQLVTQFIFIILSLSTLNAYLLRMVALQVKEQAHGRMDDELCEWDDQTEVQSCSFIKYPFLSTLLSTFSSFVSHYLFNKAPSDSGPISAAASLLLGRFGMGIFAAAYALMVLVMLLAGAAIVGVWMVRSCMEAPVCAKETLQFDYSDAHPTAVFWVGDAAAGRVPVGQTIHASLFLLIPESDYNRDIGIFQLTAEIISPGGELVAKSSHPCMLKFRSWPIRMVRTFVMSVPLLLGITSETQTINFPILKHKEARYPRTEEIRITLIPRAGTSSLPQFYEAQLVLQSRPSWVKEIAYKWKWTLHVWATFYIFIILVLVLVLFLNPFILPRLVYTPADSDQGMWARTRQERQVSESTGSRVGEERQEPEWLTRWQTGRIRRKSALLHGVTNASVDSAVCSTTVTQRDTGPSPEKGNEDEESVCFDGFN